MVWVCGVRGKYGGAARTIEFFDFGEQRSNNKQAFSRNSEFAPLRATEFSAANIVLRDDEMPGAGVCRALHFM